MKIEKFNDYNKINEVVYIPILDFIVSRDGIPLIGDNLTKGKVDFGPGGVALDILSVKGDSEIAGVNKNGDLIVKKDYIKPHDFEINGVSYIANCIYYNDAFLEIPEQYYGKLTKFNLPFELNVLNYWAIDYQVASKRNPATKLDYTPLIPIIPTGWVNIKVDMEVSKRIKRYSDPLGVKSDDPHESFLRKLEDLEKTSSDTNQSKAITTKTIQKRMATIMILHYINEIKDFFNATQSGFLFESFISGLIPDSKVVDDNGPVDIIANNAKYQIKLYSDNTLYIPMVKEKVNNPLNNPLDYYVIALKDLRGIHIYVLDGFELENPTNGYSFLTKGGNISISRLEDKLNKSNRVFGNHFYTYLDLSDLDGRINKISKKLKDTIKKLYDNISKLEYNVETIITGIDEKGKPIDDPNEIYDDTTQRIRNIEREILALNTRFNKR